MIDPKELTADRLQANDINLLLGWDAVSAHIEENVAAFGDFPKVQARVGTPHNPPPLRPTDRAMERVSPQGHAKNMAALLRAKSSKVWPPAEVQVSGSNRHNRQQHSLPHLSSPLRSSWRSGAECALPPCRLPMIAARVVIRCAAASVGFCQPQEQLHEEGAHEGHPARAHRGPPPQPRLPLRYRAQLPSENAQAKSPH